MPLDYENKRYERHITGFDRIRAHETEEFKQLQEIQNLLFDFDLGFFELPRSHSFSS